MESYESGRSLGRGVVAERSEVFIHSYCDTPKKSGGEKSGTSGEKIHFEMKINPVLDIHMELWHKVCLKRWKYFFPRGRECTERVILRKAQTKHTRFR